jgi:hypothetical protein
MSMSKADILMDAIGLFPTGDRLDSLIEQLYDLHEELEQQLLKANAANNDMFLFLEDKDKCAKRLEKRLLESKAKIEELATRLSDAQSVDSKWLALHNADVIARFHGLLDKRLSSQGTSLSTRAVAMSFANEHIEQLRNSVKEGDK